MTRRQRVGVALFTISAIAAAMNCSSNPGPAAPITEITVTPAASGLDTPLDATPSPTGKDIYFIAQSSMGKGIFHVAATGGTPDELYGGAPLVDPRSLVLSSDGTKIYVADPAAGTNGGGAVYQLPASGNTPTVVSGTEGTHPNALDVVEESGKDVLYFTGADAKGTPEILQLPAGSTSPITLASGAPLVKPNGIAVSSKDEVFVADLKGGAGGKGQVFSVAGGKAANVGPAFVPGDPTGVALTLDESKLLVSSLAADGTSQVLILDLAAGGSSTFNDVIKANTVSGGVHRAHGRDTYAWAGHTAVYSIKLRIIYADSSTPGGVGG